MTVRTRSTTPTTQVVSGSTAASILVVALQIVAVLLMLASTFGNYVQFVGGWSTDGAPLPLNWAAVLYAAVYQVGCAIAQWGCKHKAWWVAYAIALLVSAIPSFFTYNAWAGPWLTVLIGPIFSGIVIGFTVLFGDMIPEWILVD